MRAHRLFLEFVIALVCAENLQCNGEVTHETVSSQPGKKGRHLDIFSLGQDSPVMQEEPVYSGIFSTCDGSSLMGTVSHDEEAFWKVTVKEGERVEIEARRISCGMFPTLSLHLGRNLTNLPAPLQVGTNSIEIPTQCMEAHPDAQDPKLVVENIPSTGDYTIRVLGAGEQPTDGSDFEYEVNVISVDSDGDGVGDACDRCPSTDLSRNITLLEVDTGVANEMVEDGCSVNDLMPSVLDSCVDFAHLQSARLKSAKLHFRLCMSEKLTQWKDSGVFASGGRQGVMQVVRQVQHDAVYIDTKCNTVQDRPTRTSCPWSPTAQNKCRNLLKDRLFYTYANKSPDCKRIGHRWIFFGDSTMLRMVRLTEMIEFLARHANHRIQTQCPNKYDCEHRKTGRHMYNEHFDIPYRENLAWTPPDWENNAEGPLRDVPNRPYCHDCGGCRSESLVCQDLQPDESCTGLDAPVTYGGIYAVEFARDVEMQGPDFITTQQNVALFLNRTLSPLPVVQALGRPVCVVNTGTHDAQIPGITTAKFMKNMEWYLKLLDPHCEYLIYLATIAPEGERFPGHFDLTYEWNMEIKNLLRKKALRHKSTFINVFNTSIHFEHADKVHMAPEWYQSFASFFMSIIQA